MSKTTLPPITIWAHSFCRSTLATYQAFGAIYPFGCEIVMCGQVNPELRARAGFVSEEFAEMNFVAVEPSINEAIALLEARSERLHMFTAYHGSDLFRALLDYATAGKMNFFVAAEAPQNMEYTPE